MYEHRSHSMVSDGMLSQDWEDGMGMNERWFGRPYRRLCLNLLPHSVFCEVTCGPNNSSVLGLSNEYFTAPGHSVSPVGSSGVVVDVAAGKKQWKKRWKNSCSLPTPHPLPAVWGNWGLKWIRKTRVCLHGHEKKKNSRFTFKKSLNMDEQKKKIIWFSIRFQTWDLGGA